MIVDWAPLASLAGIPLNAPVERVPVIAAEQLDIYGGLLDSMGLHDKPGDIDYLGYNRLLPKVNALRMILGLDSLGQVDVGAFPLYQQGTVGALVDQAGLPTAPEPGAGVGVGWAVGGLALAALAFLGLRR